MEQIEKLKKKRTVSRTLTTKLINTCEQFILQPDVELSVLTEYIEQLTVKYQNLISLDEQIQNLMDNESEFETAETYSEKIIAMKSKLTFSLETKQKIEHNVIKTCDSSSENNLADVLASCSHSKIKLPKLTINKFEGDPASWLSFWNQYENAIHLNKDLTDLDKFNYLHSLLSGAPEKAISGYSLSSENYAAAISLLKERFGRNDLVINAHIGKLLNLDPVKNPNNIFALRKLYDNIEIQIRNLNSLDVTSGTYGTLLTPLLLKLIPSELNLEFQRKRKSREHFDVIEFTQFLRDEIECRETAVQIQDKLNTQNLNHFPRDKKIHNKNIFSTAATLKNSVNQCIFCGDISAGTEHFSDSCPKSVADRKASLRKKGICFLCLKRGNHLAKNCFSKIRCEHCRGKHSTLICERKNASAEEKKGNSNKEFSLTNKTCIQKVLLQTLIARIRGNGQEKMVRCLIDSGSQRSYLSKFAAKVMNYKCIGENNVVHSLFGGTEVPEIHKQYVVHLSNIQNDYHCNFQAFDQAKICSEIQQIEIGSYLNEIKEQGIFLSDDRIMNENLLYESSPTEVHVLIGADIAGKLLTGNIRKFNSGLVCIETYLGYTIMGKIPIEIENRTDNCSFTFSMHVSDSKITDLWNLDTLGITDPYENQTKAELQKQTLRHFQSTVKRDDEGRFEVCLPWIEGHSPLPSNRIIAENRLKSTVKRLKESGYLNEYEAVLNSWVDEKIIEIVPESEYDIPSHYLPHRAVIRMNSKTTKVRPVFDASARVKGSPSLNDCVEKGPNLIQTIPAIINRFRFKLIGVSSDIKRAFLQIGLSSKDRDYVRFLWWKEGNPEHLNVYRHRRIVFGISCSPFLLNATLSKLMEDVPEHLKMTANKLAESWYVDNLVTSVNSEEELREFKMESIEILADAKFELQDWAYNLQSRNIDLDDLKHDSLDKRETVPILGLVWDLKTDTLSCDIKESVDSKYKSITKRIILSEVNRIFDPIGFTCPITIIPKLLLQNCWELKVKWDGKLPEEISRKFIKWRKNIVNLIDVRIPRCMMLNPNFATNLSFHIFCDASQKAYATCIYLRSENQEEVNCQLVQARSRVAPLKSISISRLELMACTIGVRLMRTVKQDLRLESVPSFYWTDSMNTLYWIKNEEQWGVFVNNRVKEIRTFSGTNEWNYVPGCLNAADLPSRGCFVEALKLRKWHEGPAWLKLDQSCWPSHTILPDTEIVNSEKRKTVVSAFISLEKEPSYFNRISSFEKIVKITALVKRFINNCRFERVTGNLQVKELKEAELIIWKIVQRSSFKSETDDRLHQLHPFTDSIGLIRIKSRILMREDFENFRFPIVLPADHHIVIKLIIEKHKQLMHCGVQTLMSILREDFWILKSRKTIRKVLKSCVTCKRLNVRPSEVQHAPLPEDRVKDSAVYEVCGIDLAGPLFLRDSSKSWIVLFTCAIYRAVHLELVTSLSTDSFLLALRRFIARRGRPQIIYTDNGSNFIGSSTALKTLDWNKIIGVTMVNRISWKFIPPSAPWWGGFWERMVGLTKRILRKVLGKTSLNYEELTTVLCDCEGIMNSRPLTYVSDDVGDLSPLTPAMFIQEIKEIGVPDLDALDHQKINKRLIYRNKVRRDLRARFRNEYLGQLKQTTLNGKHSRPIKVDDIVIIWTDNPNRINWPLGRILEVYPGKDGVVRIAKIKTKSGVIIRPVKRLCALEMKEEDNLFGENKIPVTDTKIPETDESLSSSDPITQTVTTRTGRIIQQPQRYRN